MDRVFFGQKFLNGSIVCATLAEENFIQNINDEHNRDE